MPRSEIAGFYEKCVCFFKKLDNCFSRVAVPFYIPTNNVWEIAASLPSFGIVAVLCFCCFNSCVVISESSSAFSWWLVILTILCFTCSPAVYTCFSVKHLLKSFAHFLTGLFIILTVEFWAFFVYSKYKSFVRYVGGKYSLRVRSFSGSYIVRFRSRFSSFSLPMYVQLLQHHLLKRCWLAFGSLQKPIGHTCVVPSQVLSCVPLISVSILSPIPHSPDYCNYIIISLEIG